MDNHIHLLVSGRYEDCLAFFAWILHRLARVLEKKHGISGILKSQASDVHSEQILRGLPDCGTEDWR
jgi:hypothetical protein